MIDKILEIEIFDQKYRIRVKGEEDEKYINHLTSYVDQKMREVAVKSKSADAVKIAVLAALNIADEFFLNQKKFIYGHLLWMLKVIYLWLQVKRAIFIK